VDRGWCWCCRGSLRGLADGHPIVRCPECGAENQNQLVGARFCASCRYDLTSLVGGAGILTCPECGSRGSPELVCDPILPPLPNRAGIMCCLAGPNLVLCAGCAFLATLPDPDPALIPLACITAISSLLVPILVGCNLAKRHRPRQRRLWLAMVLIAAGTAANVFVGILCAILGIAIMDAMNG